MSAGNSQLGASIVDALDTLYIMGLHDEFKDGQEWIEKNLDFSVVSDPHVYFFMAEYKVVQPFSSKRTCLHERSSKYQGFCLELFSSLADLR